MKRDLFFYLKIYFKITAQNFKAKMSYREDFFISMFGMIISNLAGFATFMLLFYKFQEINGWNYNEMLFLYGFSLLALTPMQCLFDNNWVLRYKVMDGDFIKYCFRPINVFFYYMSEVFDIKGLGQLAIGIFTVIYAWNRLDLPFNLLTAFLLVVALFSASLFMIAIMNVAAAACFYILNSGYMMVTMFKFTDYAKYPASIYNTVFKFIFTFIIPIAFVAYYPSLIFLRPNEVPVLTYLSPVLGIAFFLFSYYFWMHGAKTYSGTGN